MTNNHKLGIFKDIPKNVAGEARRARAALVGRSPLLSERLRRNCLQFKVVKREKNWKTSPRAELQRWFQVVQAGLFH